MDLWVYLSKNVCRDIAKMPHHKFTSSSGFTIETYCKDKQFTMFSLKLGYEHVASEVFFENVPENNLDNLVEALQELYDHLQPCSEAWYAFGNTDVNEVEPIRYNIMHKNSRFETSTEIKLRKDVYAWLKKKDGVWKGPVDFNSEGVCTITGNAQDVIAELPKLKELFLENSSCTENGWTVV